MSIFVIGDLHLSTNRSTNKSMEKFGRRWILYFNPQVHKDFSAVNRLNIFTGFCTDLLKSGPLSANYYPLMRLLLTVYNSIYMENTCFPVGLQFFYTDSYAVRYLFAQMF